MNSLLSEEQRTRYNEFRDFVNLNIEPYAGKWDSEEEIPRDAIGRLAEAGYLGSFIPEEYGGKGWDIVTFGLLNEAVGRGISSMTDLLTIQAMVAITLLKWGTPDQKKRWLKKLATGEIIGSFALTEPNVGSAIQFLETKFNYINGKLRVNGRKRWISYGQEADLFLIFGYFEDKALACLVPRESEGLSINPIKNMMGFRATRLGQLNFNDVEIPEENIIGKPGFALSHVAPIGLQYGRISTACSALGLLRGCVEESIEYATTRSIGRKKVGDEGMIRTLLARMGTNLHAANLLCYSACKAEEDHSPDAFEKVLMAKYFTTTSAVSAASDAVQIRGASGCHEGSAVSRYYRDAKVMEIIEGTTQIHERIIGKNLLDKANKLAKKSA